MEEEGLKDEEVINIGISSLKCSLEGVLPSEPWCPRGGFWFSHKGT
jgi:hypothetical protein